MKKAVSGTILTLLLSVSILALAFNIRPVRADGTIYIRADGSIDPPTVPISTTDNVTYTFTDNINDPIIVERDNIIIDGAGYTLQRTGVRTGVGIELSERRNVKVTNTTIQNFDYGIKCLSPLSSNISIVGNNIIGNRIGIFLSYSSNNSITNNVFTGDGLVAYESYGNLVENNLVNGKPLVYLEGVSNYVVEDAGQVILLNCDNIRIKNLNLSITDDAIQLGGTNNTIIMNNHITANSEYGILLFARSNNNSIVGNNIANNSYGMLLETFSNSNSIVGNNITNNSHGMLLGGYSLSNRIFHNNFMNNTQQAVGDGTVNSWDDGYPSGGNYWSNYTGIDNCSGPYQNETDSDGIGDTPYIIGEYNMDNYPLMNPFKNFTGLVSESYNDLLFRNAEPEGFEYWVGKLRSGRLTEVDFIEAALRCVEYRQKWRNRLFIALMYEGVFERTPNQEEYDYYLTALDLGAMTWEQMLIEWLNSEEWNTRFGELNNTEFVTKLYHEMLHREPDALGLDYYVGVLEDGILTRPQLILIFYHSIEYQTANIKEKLVYQLYLGLLRRVPDAGGYQFWLSKLHLGMPKEKLIEAFLTCPEYEQKHAWK